MLKSDLFIYYKTRINIGLINIGNKRWQISLDLETEVKKFCCKNKIEDKNEKKKKTSAML